MSRHRRSDHRRDRRRRAPARPARARFVVAAAVAVTVGAGVALGMWASGDGGFAGPAGTARQAPVSPGATGPAEAAAPSPTPSPTRTWPLSKAPRTIPAVDEHTPERGPGWRPQAGRRVVIGTASLADEGRLVARELGLTYAGQRTDVEDGDLRLVVDRNAGGNEAYTLTVRGGRVEIRGGGDAGVFYGTRTLKQAVHDGGTAPEGVVKDAPAKPVRGMMLDIARKHYTPDWIEDRIRELGDLKYNQLHLHFSDDQGFRIASDSHPEIVSPQHLTKAQVRSLLKLAAERHITVVPEIDSPGHLGAVLRAHPELQLRTASGTAVTGAVDISKPAAADLLDELFEEYAALFPGKPWHLGGDEYRALTARDPEAAYPQLAAAARKAHGAGATVADLATSWLNERAAKVSSLGKTPIAWNDGFFRGTRVQPSKDIQVAYWTGKEIGARPPAEYLSAGRTVINYNDSYLYYVLGEPNQFVYPTGERIYAQWTPRVLRLSDSVAASHDRRITGGCFAIWGDFPNAQTQDRVAAGIRMPLRALAQKLWDADRPADSWAEFRGLADRLD